MIEVETTIHHVHHLFALSQRGLRLCNNFRNGIKTLRDECGVWMEKYVSSSGLPQYITNALCRVGMEVCFVCVFGYVGFKPFIILDV
jgi:hypothetical protein